jgi:hypothetical protein
MQEPWPHVAGGLSCATHYVVNFLGTYHEAVVRNSAGAI